EELLDGDLVVTVRASGRNARVAGVSVRAIESEAARRWDFKAPLHRDPPAAMDWRDAPTHYEGHDTESFGRWTARIPLSSANQAYVVSVRTRIGDAETEHSLPVRPLWHFRDPAELR
ncbi:hypothetical protein K8I85_14195, partial [bacterium]|nr:hypothetical protein [bacterium]